MTVRIPHHQESGYGWSFDSPDIPRLVGGADDHDPAEPERAALFALVCDAEDRGEPTPQDVHFKHFVPASSARR
jgi:hypothetical protein